ncbi:MAG TPA: hypothetical protein VGJ77_15565 [Gaiellaceae bacterium]|jgi:hypothetical protein
MHNRQVTNGAPQPEGRRVKRGLRIRPLPLRLIRTVEDEAKHLSEIAEAGESAETPVIMVGVVAMFVAAVVAVVLVLAFAAYYLVG